MVLLGTLALASVACLLALDHAVAGAGYPNALAHYLSFSDEAVSNSIGVLSSIVAAVLGIVITVVSIVVQLAATRYTPAITDIFFRDTTNRCVIAFYIVGCVSGFWIAFAVGDGWVPRISLMVMLSTATVGFLLMAPYFAYVFRLLSPKRVVHLIMNEAKDAMARYHRDDPEWTKEIVLSRVEHLCDIGMNAMAQKDRIIAIASVDSLGDLSAFYLTQKSSALEAWFQTSAVIKENPDFSSMDHDSLKNLEARQTWFEFKVLRQYQSMFDEALVSMNIVNHVVAVNSREIAERALSGHHLQSLELALKFFNTYLRSTLNAKNIKTANTLLNQMRLLAESILSTPHSGLALNMAEHLKYYAHLSYKRNLGFVTETIAYDMSELCEKAHQCQSPVETRLLDIFLDVDPSQSEGDIQEASLRGVRKAQLKLASYYLEQGATSLAQRIHHDMKQESTTRLRELQQELLSVEMKEFWEISERGGNFEFLSESRKGHLSRFFEWFPQQK